MRFADASLRLAVRPERLPPPPPHLAPQVRAAGGRPVVIDDAGPELSSGLVPAAETREAAVLVLVYPGPDDEAFVLLMERPEGDLRHAGEVSFPGGVVEPEDASVAAAAIREAREELGLDADQAGIEILGELDPVVVRVSGFRLTPVLALGARRPYLEPDPHEVAAALEVPLDAFAPEAPIEVVEEERHGLLLSFGAYPVAGYRIWGATARILGQLGALLGDPAAS